MAYRGGPTQEQGHDYWRIGMAVTDAWDKPFKRVGDAPAFTIMSEDPGVLPIASETPALFSGGMKLPRYIPGPERQLSHDYPPAQRTRRTWGALL